MYVLIRGLRVNPPRLLIVAGAIHLAATITVFLVGHFQLLPQFFDPNGIGLTFAIDGATYQRLASQMATHWQNYGIGPWLDIKAPLHCRLYSIAFATVGRVLGHNILAAEPLNLFYYLGILTTVYLLGRQIFNERAAFLSAAIVALWPSFFMHTTQLIRDPLAILCFLALLLALTLNLTLEFAWKPALAVGAGGVASVTVFWLTRGNMWNAVLVALALALLMLALRMVRERKFMAGNAIVLLMVVIAALFVPSRLESTTLGGVRPPVTPLAIPSASQPAPREGVWAGALNQIRHRRAGFSTYTARESDMHGGVYFESTRDIVEFIPSAVVIGFMSPFPRMWFQSGTYGSAGRLLSAAETVVMYFLYLVVGVCLWRERRRLAMWLVFLTATAAIVGMGLVVVNAGALYRLRYVFWIMLIVIAAQGLVGQLELRVSRKGAKAPRETQ